ncbi:MAG: rod shape-determining protein [bacterium]|nr:rod shape-determining protein [bacterium]
MLAQLFARFSKDLGVDLGTSHTHIYVQNRGVVINEPSIVAVNTRTDRIVAVGKEAEKMIGKTPPHIQISQPLARGVISDFEITEKMLKHFIERVHEGSFSILTRPRVVIGIPLDITEVERKAVEDAMRSAGAREVHLVEKIMATAVGARLPIKEATGTMIVDLGAGTTEIAVLSLDGVVTWKSLQTAGNELTQNIIQYVRDHFNLLLGEKMAEDIKKKLGTTQPSVEIMEMKVRGRDLLNGLPREMTLNEVQIRDAMNRSIRLITEDIKSVLEVTPPELVADIFERGMVLTGGGSLLRGIDKTIAEVTQIPVRIADDPTTCVVRGAGIILEHLDDYRDIIIAPTQEIDKNFR